MIKKRLFYEKVRMIITGAFVFAVVGSALAFTKGPSAIFCKSGLVCVYSGFQTGVTALGTTKFPCGTNPIYFNQITNCQSGGTTPNGNTDYYRNNVQ